nr:hypothetical protein [Tanacetum cinerariifolium]
GGGRDSGEVAAAEVATAVGCGGFGEWRHVRYEIG